MAAFGNVSHHPIPISSLVKITLRNQTSYKLELTEESFAVFEPLPNRDVLSASFKSNS